MANKVLTKNNKMIIINNKIVVVNEAPTPTFTGLCFTAEEANSSVELCYNYANDVPIANTAYSRDGITWTTFTPVDYETESGGVNKVVLTNVGDKVYFRNDFTDELGEGNLQFKMTGKIAASGNCNSIYSSTGFEGLTILSYYYCYCWMFQGCTSLTTAPALPATNLAGSCYANMFYGCTSLTTAPSLPATTLDDSCYQSMFSGCTSLTSAPDLPATTLAVGCYDGMFSGCTSLTTAPELPATTLSNYCYYNMFYGCTNINVQDTVNKLTSHIDFTSTTAPVGLQGIFAGLAITDSMLASILPNYSLPATSLAEFCYYNMFYGCTSLTTAPELPATSLAEFCYYNMFYGCTSLTTAPALPATNLAYRCYYNMFYGCTSLTTAPELPATSLAEFCYYNMFYGCTSLQVSDTQTAEAPYAWHIPTNGTFTNTISYDQINMFTNCLGTRSSNTMSGALGESHTYYTQNEPI